MRTGELHGCMERLSSVHAPPPPQTTSLYARYAPSYDELDDGSLSELAGFPQLRAELLAKASGEVLEVAVGTGLNLGLYDWSRVQQLTGVDISEGMLKQAQSRVAEQLSGRPITLKQVGPQAQSCQSACPCSFPSGKST